MFLFPPVTGFIQPYEVIEAFHFTDVNLTAIELFVRVVTVFPRFFGVEVIFYSIIVHKTLDITDVHLLDSRIGNVYPIGLNVFQEVQADVHPHAAIKVSIPVRYS